MLLRLLKGKVELLTFDFSVGREKPSDEPQTSKSSASSRWTLRMRPTYQIEIGGGDGSYVLYLFFFRGRRYLLRAGFHGGRSAIVGSLDGVLRANSAYELGVS